MSVHSWKRATKVVGAYLVASCCNLLLCVLRFVGQLIHHWSCRIVLHRMIHLSTWWAHMVKSVPVHHRDTGFVCWTAGRPPSQKVWSDTVIAYVHCCLASARAAQVSPLPGSCYAAWPLPGVECWSPMASHPLLDIVYICRQRQAQIVTCSGILALPPSLCSAGTLPRQRQLPAGPEG